MSSFDDCKWVHKKKLNILPPARWGHSSAILEDNMYIFGGKLNNPGKKLTEPVYKLNCESYEFERFNFFNGPSIRDSHTGVFIKKNMWIWGGCSREKATNDCYEFKGNFWQKIFQFGDIPSARDSQLSIVFQDRWILLIGGYDQDKCFQDAYLLDTSTIVWKKINFFEGTLPFRQNTSICLINDHIYLFGGLSTDEKYSNEMFRLKLKNYESTLSTNYPILSVQQIKYENKAPYPRCSHSAVSYKNRYMIIMGGQTNCKTTNKKIVQQLLNDVWVFDILNNSWQQIQPKNPEIFKGLANFTATLYKDQIIIFGGLKQLKDYVSTDQLLVLELVNSDDITKEKKLNTLCSACKMIFREVPLNQVQFSNKKHLISKIDLQMVYKLSQLIDHPFEAFSLFIRNAELTSSSLISIDLLQAKQGQKKYLKILLNCIRMIDKNDIIKFLFEIKYNELSEGSNNVYLKEYEEKQRQSLSNKIFFNNLRFAGFRLGQTIVFCTKINQDQIFVALINRNSIYYYTQNIKTHIKSDQNDYAIIKNIMSSSSSIQESQFDKLVSNSEDKFNTVIYVLNLNRINHNQQLALSQSEIICTFKNKYKNPIQSRLSNYLSYHFLHPTPNPIKLYIQGRQIKWVHMQVTFDQTYQKITLNHIPQANLYQGSNFENIILYQDNQMVNFLRRFNKFSFITGYLSLSKEYILNVFSNRLETKIVQEALECAVEKQILNWSEQRKLKRNATTSISSLEKQVKSLE